MRRLPLKLHLKGAQSRNLSAAADCLGGKAADAAGQTVADSTQLTNLEERERESEL